MKSSLVNHSEGSVMAWVCMDVYGAGSLIYTKDATQDGSRMNSENYRNILFANLQRNPHNLIGRNFIRGKKCKVLG